MLVIKSVYYSVKRFGKKEKMLAFKKHFPRDVKGRHCEVNGLKLYRTFPTYNDPKIERFEVAVQLFILFMRVWIKKDIKSFLQTDNPQAYLTLFSIYTDFNALNKKALGKQCGKR